MTELLLPASESVMVPMIGRRINRLPPILPEFHTGLTGEPVVGAILGRSGQPRGSRERKDFWRKTCAKVWIDMYQMSEVPSWRNSMRVVVKVHRTAETDYRAWQARLSEPPTGNAGIALIHAEEMIRQLEQTDGVPLRTQVEKNRRLGLGRSHARSRGYGSVEPAPSLSRASIASAEMQSSRSSTGRPSCSRIDEGISLHSLSASSIAAAGGTKYPRPRQS